MRGRSREKQSDRNVEWVVDAEAVWRCAEETGNEIRDTKLLNNESGRGNGRESVLRTGVWAGRKTVEVKKINARRHLRAHTYLGDEDAGNAFRIVPFGIGRAEELLSFALLKAV